MACLHQGIDGLVDITHEHHAGGRRDRIPAAGERPVGHVALHDLDAVRVLEIDAGYLVEGHHVPQPHQADLPAGHIVEEVGHRGLAAGDHDAVRADFLVDVGLARPPRPQFADVVVVLHEGHEARQEVPQRPLVQHRWFHSG